MLASGFAQDLVVAERGEEDGLEARIEFAERVGAVLAPDEEGDGVEVND